jgi:hypothetical protein
MLNCTGITTLKGSTEYIGNILFCNGCKNLESLDGCPAHIGKHLECRDCDKMDKTLPPGPYIKLVY